MHAWFAILEHRAPRCAVSAASLQRACVRPECGGGQLAAVAAEREYTVRLVDDLSQHRLTWNIEEMRRLVGESSEAELELVRRAMLAAETEAGVE